MRGECRKIPIKTHHIALVSNWSSDGKGVSEMEKLLTVTTGTRWIKNTIKYLVKQYCSSRF